MLEVVKKKKKGGISFLFLSNQDILKTYFLLEEKESVC